MYMYGTAIGHCIATWYAVFRYLVKLTGLETSDLLAILFFSISLSNNFKSQCLAFSSFHCHIIGVSDEQSIANPLFLDLFHYSYRNSHFSYFPISLQPL